ncbi:hypothetical protein BDY21DRAFT_336227 [Lineolata rhizophorae]|uniref:Uncharacterized protein n=1 Tax=Lineolata rhizophorae TaxID=578093 RepID=A0A6A6P9V0_9PEZI|nr:hypothetical protein BDY21DRAFT_336227 [Lineolata rhizophorae]
MSLVTDAYTAKLWEGAQDSSSWEHPTVSFWNYILSKHFFADKNFLVDRQKPAAKDESRRRVDIVVKHFEDNDFRLRPRIEISFGYCRAASYRSLSIVLHRRGNRICLRYNNPRHHRATLAIHSSVIIF